MGYKPIKKTNMKQHINTLLSTEMDRREFLKYIAAAGIMMMGGGLLMQSLGGLEKLGTRSAQQKSLGSYGYGASVYGGNPR